MRKTREHLTQVKRTVVKVGSSVLTHQDGHPNPLSFRRIADQVSHLAERNMSIVLVSSGAIAAGIAKLGLRERPRSLPEKQAAAAVGQTRLMHYYEEAFRKHGITVGQILLTHDDLRDRKRFLNARHTMEALLENGIVPIVNENDSVAVEEIMVGDNDNLSALVASLVEADALVILSDIDGVYEADPRKDKEAKFVPVVKNLHEKIRTAKRSGSSHLTIGGMATKFEAAETASHFGIPTVIANGRFEGVLAEIFDGKETGSIVLPKEERLEGRKHWIAFALKPAGEIIVDEGAKRAIVEKGRSLLPIGVKEVRGTFGPGDAVRVMDERKKEIARGLVEYGSEDIAKMKGLRTLQIKKVLGEKYTDEIIHRDDLAVF